MATDAARRMQGVVAGLAPYLRSAGFRKQRHTFNRVAEPGLVHVISFQMGSHDPPGTASISGLRENRYGQFAVNVGIFVEEVARAFDQLPRGGVIHEYDCEIRGRAGRLASGDVDPWIALAGDVGDVTARVEQLLASEVLPFFDSMSSRSNLVEAWFRNELEGMMTPRSPLAMAVVLKDLGHVEAARRLAADYLARETHSAGHLEWARQRARELELD